jgi:hypothetical protein
VVKRGGESLLAGADSGALKIREAWERECAWMMSDLVMSRTDDGAVRVLRLAWFATAWISRHDDSLQFDRSRFCFVNLHVESRCEGVGVRR